MLERDHWPDTRIGTEATFHLQIFHFSSFFCVIIFSSSISSRAATRVGLQTIEMRFPSTEFRSKMHSSCALLSGEFGAAKYGMWCNREGKVDGLLDQWKVTHSHNRHKNVSKQSRAACCLWEILDGKKRNFHFFVCVSTYFWCYQLFHRQMKWASDDRGKALKRCLLCNSTAVYSRIRTIAIMFS